MSEIVDYIIVGSGPGGSVLAKRLADSGRYTVAVIEAGGPADSLYIRIPAGFVKTLNGTRYAEHYDCLISNETGRGIKLPQGRVLGGSSAINGLAYSRGQREDFDDW